MKIGILSAYQGGVLRGAERFVEEISKRLKNGYDVVIFSAKVKPLKRWSFFWRFFIDPQGIFIFWFTFKNLINLWREKFDIVIPINGGWQPALVRLLTWLRGGRMVVIGHSGIGWDDRNNIYCFPDAFVGLTSRQAKWAKRINPFIKVYQVPDGVNLEVFKPLGPKVDIPLPRPIILMVGALVKEKRMELAIEAVSRLKKASLLILGEGDYETEIRKLANLKLRGRFMIKKVGFEEIANYYRSCDLFTLPSWPNEAFGMVYLEALASGLPVVAPNDEQRKEIVGNAGILVDPTDTNAYAQALKMALKIDWGSKPRKQAQKFSWDKIVKKYEEIFEELT